MPRGNFNRNKTPLCSKACKRIQKTKLQKIRRAQPEFGFARKAAIVRASLSGSGKKKA